jgi:hypothetical protein
MMNTSMTYINKLIRIFPLKVETRHGASVSVDLKVYDVLGREVVTLVNETKQPGHYDVKSEGANLPCGVYFYK